MLCCTKYSVLLEDSPWYVRVCETECSSRFGVTFQRGTTGGLCSQVCSVAEYASRAADRRPVSGGLVMCGGVRMSCLPWIKRRVTLSSTEAEWVVLVDVANEVVVFEAGLAFHGA